MTYATSDVYWLQFPSPLPLALVSKLPSERMHHVVEPPSIVDAGAFFTMNAEVGGQPAVVAASS
jgi:hypothetical protein